MIKMVPASGAASRMFKDIFAFINGKTEKPDTDFIRLFFDKIEKIRVLPQPQLGVCIALHGRAWPHLMDEKKYKDVARALIRKRRSRLLDAPPKGTAGVPQGAGTQPHGS